MRKFLALLGLLLLTATAVQADDILRMDYIPSATIAAVGGPHPAMISGISTMFLNPAGLRSVDDGEISFAQFSVGMHGPIFDIANLLVEATNGADLMTLIAANSALLTNLYAGIDLTGPIFFGYAGKGLGFGIFNMTDVTFKTVGGMSVAANVGEQLLLTGGYAFRIGISDKYDSNLDMGIMLKASVRGEMELSESIFTLLSNFGSVDLLGAPFTFSVGIGADLGMRLSVSDIFAFGLVVEDVFTPVFNREYANIDDFINAGTPVDSNEILPIRVNTGFMISPPLGKLGRVISDLDIYLSFNNMLDYVLAPAQSQNPLLNLAAGIDLKLLEIFSFKFGFYEGLFSAGLQLDLTIFRFNAAMYGTERGVEPGQNPVYNIMIGLEFRK